MKKKILMFLGFLGLAFGLTSPSFAKSYTLNKADSPTSVGVSSVSNQNIAGGYGLGIAVLFDSNLNSAYWEVVDATDYVHLYDAKGVEQTVSVEEVGSQLCINRLGGCDLKGYTLEFLEGWSFTTSTGSSYVLDDDYTFVCELENGVTGQNWTLVEQATKITISSVSNQNIAGGYGLGIAVLFDSNLNSAYWEVVDASNFVHLYDSSDVEQQVTVEEVGSQLCINRNGGCDLKGYKLVFDFGWRFTDSKGNNYVLWAPASYVCYLENGVTGQNWTLDVPATETSISAVSNQNIAGVYGLGIAIAFDPALDGGYWSAISDTNGVHLYDSNDAEQQITVEEVGGQLCINRNGGCDFKGYSLTFDAGWTFTLSSGTRFKITESKTYICNLENGVTGQNWDLKGDEGEPVKVSAVSNQNIAGGYGLGMSIEFNPGLSGSYWAQVVNTDGIHLYDTQNNEVSNKYLEEVGSQLCLNRINSDLLTNYRGYSITFDEGWTFNVNGTKYCLSESSSFFCKGDNGSTGYYWETLNVETTLSLADASVEMGKTVTLAPTCSDNTPLYSFYSSDTDVATVDVATGVVTAVAEGSATITVYTQRKSATATITVTEATDSVSSISVSEDLTISQYSDIPYGNIRGYATFASGDIQPITVTSEMVTGTVDTDTPGTYTMTLTYEGKTCSFDIVVTELVELTIGQFFGNDSPWGTPFYATFSNDQASRHVFLADESLENAKSHILIKGSHDHLQRVLNTGENRYEFFLDDVTFVAGDKIEIEAGLFIYTYDGTVDGNLNPNGDGKFIKLGMVKTGWSYVYTGNGWAIYTGEPSTMTISAPGSVAINETANVTVSVGPEGTYGTPVIESSDPSILSVNGTSITGVSEGRVELTATLGSLISKATVEVLPEKSIKGVSFENIPNYFSILKGTDISTFNPDLTNIHLVFVDDTVSGTINVSAEDVRRVDDIDTSVVNDMPVDIAYKVTVSGVEYDAKISVQVYEYYDQEPTEVGIVDWFAYALFIQLPNTCSNAANITDSSAITETLNNIEYRRADGTPVSFGAYQLGTNIALFMQFGDGVVLDENNYNDYYLVGDTVTLKANCPIFKWTGDIFDLGNTGSPVAGTGEFVIDGYVKQDITYRYDGNIWGLYIPYTDMTVSSDNLSVDVGSSVNAGAHRIPENATSGAFEYSSSDETVATVSAQGIIRGISEGTATITVKISEDGENVITKTITVTVVDSITGIKVNGSLSVNKGTEKLDLSSLEVYEVYGSGKQGNKLDLSAATVSGYDPEKVGEQNVVITVKVGEKTYTARVTVNVKAAEAKGCGGSIIAANTLVASLAIAGFALISKKKKEDK